jgi:hypothetical protein
MAEIAPPGGGGTNRRFLFIVGGLGALLAVGLLALAFTMFGMPFITRLTTQPTATRVAVVATVTLAPTLTRAATSVPSATATVQVALAATATAAPSTATPTVLAGAAATTAPGAPTTVPTGTGGQLPQSGLGETFLLLMGGVVLVVALFLIRRARLAR